MAVKRKKFMRPVRRKNSKRSIKNSSLNYNGLLSGVFDSYGYGTLSDMSNPFQLGGSNQYNPLTLNRVLLSYAYMTHGVIQTFIDQPVEDAFRGGIDFETDELDEDEIQLLQDVLVECKDYSTMKYVMKWARLFGGAGLIINTNQDPTKELDISSIDDDSPLSFLDADRWELTLNFLLEDRTPTPYNYYGQPIHKSRVIKLNGKEAPSFIRRRLQGWGMSELERCIRDVNSYVKNQDVIYELLDEAKIDIWRLQGLNAAMLSANANTKISNRLNLATLIKNYQRALVMDKDDEYEQKQITFGGLADIQTQNRIGVAASVRMPITKLFGQSATGFNSGEDDIENYNSVIESEIRGKAIELVHTVVKLRCQQLFGFIPEHFDCKFKPLRVLNQEQVENIKNHKLNRASTLYSQGILSGSEYCEHLRKDEVLLFEPEVEQGKREPEPPMPSADVDIPQKPVKAKDSVGRKGTSKK